jgi:hypothetical protein
MSTQKELELQIEILKLQLELEKTKNSNELSPVWARITNPYPWNPYWFPVQPWTSPYIVSTTSNTK